MDAAYIPLKLVHMLAVAASGTLFFLRGLAINFFAAKWPMNAPVRYASYTIDTVLLAAAIALTIVIGQYPFVDSWLTVKVLLVIVALSTVRPVETSVSRTSNSEWAPTATGWSTTSNR